MRCRCNSRRGTQTICERSCRQEADRISPRRLARPCPCWLHQGPSGRSRGSRKRPHTTWRKIKEHLAVTFVRNAHQPQCEEIINSGGTRKSCAGFSLNTQKARFNGCKFSACAFDSCSGASPATDLLGKPRRVLGMKSQRTEKPTVIQTGETTRNGRVACTKVRNENARCGREPEMEKAA